MLKEVFFNRWLIWAIVAIVVVGIYVWYQIEAYNIEMEYASNVVQVYPQIKARTLAR